MCFTRSIRQAARIVSATEMILRFSQCTKNGFRQLRPPRHPISLELAGNATFQAVKVAKLSPLVAAHALLKTSSSLELVGIDQNAGIS
jgi:hypothetical protein